MISRGGNKLKPLAPRPSPTSDTALNQSQVFTSCATVPGGAHFDVSRMGTPTTANRNAFVGANLGVPASPLEAVTSMDPKDYVWGTPAAPQPGVFPPFGVQHQFFFPGQPFSGYGGQQFMCGFPGQPTAIYQPQAVPQTCCAPPTSGAPVAVVPGSLLPSFQAPMESSSVSPQAESPKPANLQGDSESHQDKRESDCCKDEVDVDQLLDSVIDLDDESLQTLLEGHVGGTVQDVPLDADKSKDTAETGMDCLNEKPDMFILPADSQSDGSTNTEAKMEEVDKQSLHQLDTDTVPDKAHAESSIVSFDVPGLRTVPSYDDFDLVNLAGDEPLAVPLPSVDEPIYDNIKRVKSEAAIKAKPSPNPLSTMTYEEALAAIAQFLETDRRVPEDKRSAIITSLQELHCSVSLNPQTAVETGSPKRKRSLLA